ncbi:hypothetical protein Pmar_PMAR020403 [Perkinsus marinus ATCC 50983]|uniref:Uncharacterized protein n=1 Tax=Perkinsus marinus (strain ATCC 50983 / TXsc) TaxID=423536 RepID=C5L6Y2_PERM5|nr:hypothetical protein Pmar_PMAR020403 [Perkinsus marinus ATCC 50983]EER07244.1 hypothetical protein Pmar_PMAR020403 [Perkinsus marinus ATCC 50983]|eukprot:XP_002775428.1 hypothetical protein Pmar_PMAR020403 [Perkinsus marinus ATCC 50983]
MTNVCLPKWYVNSNSECPYGTHLAGDVTLPYNAGFLEGLSVMFGFVPYAAGIFFILITIWRRGLHEYSIIIFGIIVVASNEYGWKNIADQARPVGSCCTSCGMPSSHAVITTALWTILALDFSYRVSQTPQGYSGGLTSFVDRFRAFLHAGHLLPTASVISEDHFVAAAGFWSLALLPVPLSRIILKDHTSQQVFVAGIIGVVEGIIWFLLTLLLRVKTENYTGRRWLRGCFIHNWPAPRCFVPLKNSDITADGSDVRPPSTGVHTPRQLQQAAPPDPAGDPGVDPSSPASKIPGLV